MNFMKGWNEIFLEIKKTIFSVTHKKNKITDVEKKKLTQRQSSIITKTTIINSQDKQIKNKMKHN